MKLRKTLSLAFLLTAGIAPSVPGQTAKLPVPPEIREPKVAIAWNRLYDYPEVVAHLRRLNQAYPQLTTLESIGKSSEGRDMWLLTVCNRETGLPDEKPAMWIDANVHGNEVQGAEACLYLAWHLLENHGRVPAITEQLARNTFYILPMVNPDGRAWWFQGPNTGSSSRSGKQPTDNDGDGALDEDGYDDLNGDGEILEMRKRDPYGRWKTSPDDPRVMVRVKPDERGEWTRLGLEGIDNDGDGRVNEDGPGGYDMNRNWPSFWMPNHIQFGAGEYPFSQPETRAIGDFLLDHPNVAAVQSFHNMGGMILRGPGVESYGSYPREDVTIYDRLGKTGEEMIPFYRYLIIWKDLYSVYGGFATWTYEGLGIFSFTNEQWTGRRRNPGVEANARGRGGMDRHRFNDLLRSGIDFVDWQDVEHPTYGSIQVGGFRKTTSRTPPSFLIEEGSHRNALFCLYHASEMPEIKFAPVTVTPLVDGKSRIDVIVENARQIPSVSAQARLKRIGQPDLLRFESSGVKVVFAGEIQSQFPERLNAVRDEPQRIRNWNGVRFDRPYRVRYVVEGSGSFRLVYRSQKGGVLRLESRVPE